MKKIILALFIPLVICSASSAQDTIVVKTTPPPAPPPAKTGKEKRINLYGVYTFDDSFDSYYDDDSYYEGKIKGGFQYGVGLEFMVKVNYGVELLYIGQMTTAPTTYYSPGVLGGGGVSGNLDLTFNYAMLAFGRKMQKPDSPVEGYGGLMLGALFSSAKNPNNGDSNSGTRFAWGARLGANIWINEKMAIKLQGQLLSAVQSVGGSLYFGTGGAGAGASTYSSMLQFGVGGGLAFKLGK
ncbi:MAG: porin family protein [Bacteroidia bacterium]